jgi:hypothetical protein
VGAETIPVNPWTLAWWGTLPGAYRAADAVQAAPGLLYQVGLNAEPLFVNGFDGWNVEALNQTTDSMTLRMTRAFFGVDLSQAVVFQAWWTADAPGAEIALSLADATGANLGTHDYTDLPTGDGDDTLVSALGAASPITATLTFTTPVGDGGLLFNIRGVNVGHRAVAFEALPGNAVSMNYPLLRFMDGPGQIAGTVRGLSDGLWSGEFMDPRNTPDSALRWVAQLMGVSATIRNQSPADLRAYLVDLADNGRPASGTRGDIANAARKYLTGDKQAIMIPSPTKQHSLIMLVREDELPGADVDQPAALAALVASVRATGVVPAGHELVALIAAPTWDQWETAAGMTWAELEAAAPTWTRADSLGVTITE